MYSRGNNRLFYQSNIDSPQNVTAKIITPSLEEKGPLEMTYTSDGLYYLDVSFKSFGPYLFNVYEEGIKKYRQILRVDEGKYIIYANSNSI